MVKFFVKFIFAFIFSIIATNLNAHFMEYNENGLYHSLYNRYPITEPGKGVKLHSYSEEEGIFIQVVDLENASVHLEGSEDKYKPIKSWLNRDEFTFSVMNGMPFEKSTHTLCVGDKKGDIYENKNSNLECDYKIFLVHSKYAEKETANERIYVALSESGEVVVFFIAKNKTHQEMVNLAKEWFVKDEEERLFFIESGNIQFSTKKFSLNKGGQLLSHVIITKPKW